MIIDLRGNGNTYLGTVRSASHNGSTGFTTIVFSGGIVKRFMDKSRTHAKRISEYSHAGARTVMILLKTDIINGYAKDK